MNIKIAVAYHKKSALLNHKYLIPVHAGKAVSTAALGIQGDDEGDNISEKNPWYCELTVLYWLWKNTTADYKGLMHYRRVFISRKGMGVIRLTGFLKFIFRRFSSIWAPYHSVGIKKQYGLCEESFVKEAHDCCDGLDEIFAGGTQMVVPMPGVFYMSIRRTLSYEVGGKSIELMDEIVRNRHPEFYPYYEKAMNGLVFYNANMAIMQNEIFEDYCSILFDILQQHEQETLKRGILKDISTEKAYSRLSGYLAEMLTNAYIQYAKAKGIKMKTMPVAFLES